ncbi:MAG: murein biosynthesis integral membrane protein MurJ [Rhodobacteraceae bacterium]|nr:murein biosynthesis integral membrane protein MurJ [Paracoccaceae bacterium]
MKPIRLLTGFVTVGGWTLLSRVLGFIRDAMIVALLGTGTEYSAYIVAFTLPNMFRRFFAEGAFNMAFVPLFAKRLETGDAPAAFAQEAFSALTWVLIVLNVVAHLAMPLLVFAMASGFVGNEEFGLAVDYGRICFPYILFISLTALSSGVLNATGHFGPAAAAPVVLNVIFILFLTVAALTHSNVALALVWSVPVAGLAQLMLVWRAAARHGFPMFPSRPRLTPEVRKLALIAAPAALATGVVQINLLVGRQVASYFDRAIDWMYTADRLYQLPLGVVGIAVGIVLLPELSRRLAAGDMAGGRHALSRAGEVSLALTVPAAVALVVIAEPLVSVLFQRGRFTAEDVAGTALATAIYGLGLPAFVLDKVFQPLFYARSDTWSPFRYAIRGMLINAVCAIGLAPLIGWPAAAIGTTVAGWAMIWFLWRGSRGFGEVVRFDDRFRHRLPRLIVSSLLMGIALWFGAWALDGALHTDGLRYLALAGLVAGGGAVYFAFAHLLGAMPLGELKGAFRRKPKPGR